MSIINRLLISSFPFTKLPYFLSYSVSQLTTVNEKHPSFCDHSPSKDESFLYFFSVECTFTFTNATGHLIEISLCNRFFVHKLSWDLRKASHSLSTFEFHLVKPGPLKERHTGAIKLMNSAHQIDESCKLLSYMSSCPSSSYLFFVRVTLLSSTDTCFILYLHELFSPSHVTSIWMRWCFFFFTIFIKNVPIFSLNVFHVGFFFFHDYRLFIHFLLDTRLAAKVNCMFVDEHIFNV